LEIDDYLARSTDEEGDLERIRKAVSAGAEMLKSGVQIKWRSGPLCRNILARSVSSPHFM
jgi:hypothetical protein